MQCLTVEVVPVYSKEALMLHANKPVAVQNHVMMVVPVNDKAFMLDVNESVQCLISKVVPVYGKETIVLHADESVTVQYIVTEVVELYMDDSSSMQFLCTEVVAVYDVLCTRTSCS